MSMPAIDTRPDSELLTHKMSNHFPHLVTNSNNSQQITRRQLIENSLTQFGTIAVAGSIAQWSPATEAVGGTNPSKGYVDAHVHVWTPDTTAYPLAPGNTIGDMKPASFTPEQLFSHCRPCGVDRIVLIQMSFYGFDNTYMLDTIQQFPGVFVGVAVIDDEAQQPESEMRRLKSLGVKGFRLMTHDRDADKWLASDGIQRMWKCGGEENLAMCMLSNADVIPSIDRMCQEFPDTPVVIDHMARIGVDGQVRDSDVDILCRLARHPQSHVKISAFYALGKKSSPYDDLAPMIRRLYEAYGPQRLMWASDCPFQVDPGHNYKDSVNLVSERLDFLSDEDREWLLRRTAENFYFS